MKNGNIVEISIEGVNIAPGDFVVIVGSNELDDTFPKEFLNKSGRVKGFIQETIIDGFFTFKDPLIVVEFYKGKNQKPVEKTFWISEIQKSLI